MRVKHDHDLILKIRKDNPKDLLKDVVEKYCKEMGFTYTEGIRTTITKIIANGVPKGNIELKELPEFKSAKKRSIKKSSKRFIITYAQAHTPIDKVAFDGLEAYAEKIKADVIVIPGVYSNPNTVNKPYKTGWHPRVLKYMLSREDKLHPFLSIISDANVLPTAERPLRGFEGVTGDESSIVGHPRHHIEVVPTLPQSRDKFLMTTGAMTVPNYRDARVGKKAKFHHQIGFLIVEIFDKENFNFRQVSCDKNGHFQDLKFVWDGKEISDNGEWDTLILGDLHLGHHDKVMLDYTKGLAEKMGTKHVVCHDIFDGRSVNHHASKDFVHQVLAEKSGDDSLDLEIKEMIMWLKEWENLGLVIIPSNHNDWLDRWVRGADSKVPPKNAVLFNMFRSILYQEEAPKGLVAYLVDRTFKGKIKTLHRDDSFMRKGYELNSHGDLGSNGAKGTATTFKKLNVKIVSGDKHFLYQLDGASGVGVSTNRKHGYNQGLSSWTQSHGVVNKNGKFQHLNYVQGKFSELI